MNNIGYYNGTIDLLDKMMIPMNDRVVYFGDGVYDATIAVNHVIFALNDHIDRFFESFSQLRIPFVMSKNELAKLLQEVVNKVDDTGTLMVYWQVSRGTDMRDHAFPDKNVPANLLITISPVVLRDINWRYKLITLEDTRHLHCNIKTLNLIPNVMASQQSKEAGCDEAVFLRGEIVTECAHSNISIISKGIFRTAPLSNMILPGIARKYLIRIAEKIGIPVDETSFTLDELMKADEVIVSSSAVLCNAASQIDKIAVGGHDPDTLRSLQNAVIADFEEYTNVCFADYAK